jgi:hypothetical protein
MKQLIATISLVCGEEMALMMDLSFFLMRLHRGTARKHSFLGLADCGTHRHLDKCESLDSTRRSYAWSVFRSAGASP